MDGIRALEGVIQRVRALETLLEATRIVAAAGDLDATLDALAGQARRLFAADDVGINLLIPGTDQMARRRPSTLAAADSPYSQLGTLAVRNARSRAAVADGHAVFVPDLHADPAIPRAAKQALPSVVSEMYVPLRINGGSVGELVIRWCHAHETSPEELGLAEAFAQHAALAVRSARLLEEAEHARAEVEAVLDAVGESIVVVGRNERVVRMNSRARATFAGDLGAEPWSLEALEGVLRTRTANGASDLDLVRHALDGSTEAQELAWWAPDGRERCILAAAVPVYDTEENVVAAVLAARDVTTLRDAVAARARLDGVLLAARTAQHELTNSLALTVGHAEIVTEDPELPEPLRRHAESAMRGAEAAVEALMRLRAVTEIRQKDWGPGIEPTIDLAPPILEERSA